MNISLAESRLKLTLKELKAYSKESGINILKKESTMKRLSDIATHLAVLSWTDQRLYENTIKEMNAALADEFFKSLSFMMTGFIKTMDSIVKSAIDPWPETELQACQNEESDCIPYLKQAYNDVYLPFEVNKFPYDTLGFGIYMAYFSKLLTGSDNKVFFDRASLNKGEVEVREIMHEVLSMLVPTNSSEISLFELVELLNENEGTKDKTINDLKSLKMEMNCDSQFNYFQEISESNNPHCENSTFHSCCPMLTMFDRALVPILKIFRYAMQPPVYSEDIDELTEIYPELDNISYPLVSKVPSLMRNLIASNTNARIFMCQYAGKPKTLSPSNCNIFYRSITNEGFGYSFNKANFWDIFSKTDYNMKFAEILRPKGFNESASPSPMDEEDDSQRWVYPRNGVLFPETSGPDYGLTVFLQSSRLYESDGSSLLSFPPFRVSIHDPMSVADLRRSGVEVEAGYISTFLITPSQIVTSKSARGLPEEKRECRFQFDSQSLTLFNEYTQSSCIFECQLKKALEKCHCMPWNYPQLNGSHPICHRVSNKCFEKVMSDSNSTIDCNCPFDCATTRYAYSVSSTAFDPIVLCNPNNKDSLAQALNQYLGKNDMAYPPKFIRRFEQVVYDRDIGEDKICQENLKGMAIVKFQLASQIITRIKKTQRVTFADQLSNIGKLLSFCISCVNFTALKLLFHALHTIK